MVSVLSTFALGYALDIRGGLYFVFLFTCVYAVIANLQYIYTCVKGKISLAGGSIAHAGFGIMLLGVVVSSVNKQVISYNNTGSDFINAAGKKGKEKKSAVSFNQENILLQKGVPVMLGDYRATYFGDTFIKPNKFYKVRYERIDLKTKKVKEEFVLEPFAQFNDKMGGLVTSPDTRHYLSRDIFTHVNHESALDKEQPWANKLTHVIQKGDTITTVDAMHKIVLMDIRKEGTEDGSKIAIRPQLLLKTIQGEQLVSPSLVLDMDRIQERGSIEEFAERKSSTLNELGLKIELTRILLGDQPEEVQYVFTTEQRPPKKDYIILKAIVFPWINLLWLGTLVMIFGFLLSIFRRVKEYNKTQV